MQLAELIFYMLCTVCFCVTGTGQQVELDDNFYYLDGEKFFVKGIGYEVGAWPGELPWTRSFDPDQLRFDIARIEEAGFNTIRTWDAFTEQELDVIEEYDIKIIMGIWVDPEGDFSDPFFRDEAKNIISNVLDYSADYDNIIGYLIMNEPLPEVIFAAGYAESVSLWQELMAIIQNAHSGRPVSIANTSNGTYIDPDIFDYSIYNAYIYNPVTINFLHTYQTFVSARRDSFSKDAPLILSEFGLSVSPTGPGGWDYGGNTLQEQSDGILHMYRSLVDGGGAGACVFNYSDGWWKRGNEFVHDDNVEEWFGLVEYADINDQEGTPRPAWHAVSAYQSAIITEPRSGEVYINTVPIEFFPSGDITRAAVVAGADTLKRIDVTSGHVSDTIEFATLGPLSQALQFIFYDESNSIIKQELKSILIVNEELDLPQIEVAILNEDFWSEGMINVEYSVYNNPDFNVTSQLRHIFYPHIGFDFGSQYQMAMPAGDTFAVTRSYSIPPNADAITVGASFDAEYQGFEKRIVGERILSKADSIVTAVHSIAPREELSISPNPASKVIRIQSDGFQFDSYQIVDMKGRICREGVLNGYTINVSGLPTSAYILICSTSDKGWGITGRFVKQ